MGESCPKTLRQYSYADSTRTEIEKIRPRIRAAIIPLGACEQHGLGMALKTDTARAEFVADRVAENLDGAVMVTPAIPIGVSEHHMEIPGTLSLSPSTLELVVSDLVSSLHRHGIRRIFMLTGHGGNLSTLDVASVGLRKQYPDSLFAWSGLTSVVADIVNDISGSDVRGHSDEMETSQSLYVDESLVRRHELAVGTSTFDQLDAAGQLSRTNPGFQFPQSFAQLSPTGGLGDPTKANYDDGKLLVETMISRIARFIRKFIELSTPESKSTQSGVEHA